MIQQIRLLINSLTTMLIISITSTLIASCSGGSVAPTSNVTVNLSTTLPYSTTHAGIQTPLMVLFSGPIESNTINGNSFYISANYERLTGIITIGENNESITFTPDAPMALNTQYTIHVTSDIRDNSGLPIKSYNSTFTTQAESYTIFVANNNSQGWLGDLLGAAITSGATDIATGIQGADYLCQQDPQCTSGKVCKGIIADGINRDATLNANGINWVLAPYTSYKNQAGYFIGITGINSAATTSVFAFPLTSAFSAVFTPLNNQVWTGLQNNWNTKSGETCLGWTSSSGAQIGNVGSPGITVPSILDAIALPCDGSGVGGNFNGANELYCAVQP